MANPTVSSAVQPSVRLFTVADLAAMPTHLPSGDVDYELDKGRLIIMVPPGHIHGSTQASLAIEIGVQGQRRGHGRVYTETTVVLSRNPDTVVVPDAAFVVAAKLPVRESREGYLETIPDLVGEVRSKNDTVAELDRKVADYLTAGVRVVWVADPESKTIAAHRAGSQSRIYRESDTLTIDDVIPGLKLNVADIYSQ